MPAARDGGCETSHAKRRRHGCWGALCTSTTRALPWICISVDLWISLWKLNRLSEIYARARLHLLSGEASPKPPAEQSRARRSPKPNEQQCASENDARARVLVRNPRSRPTWHRRGNGARRCACGHVSRREQCCNACAALRLCIYVFGF